MDDEDEPIGYQMVDDALSYGAGYLSQNSQETQSSLRHSPTERQYASQLLRGLQLQLAEIRKQEKWSPELLNKYYKLTAEIKSLKGEFIYLIWDKDDVSEGNI